MTDAVLVVELGLRDRVVDVDRGEKQLAVTGQLVEPVDAGRGLFSHTDEFPTHAREALRVAGERAPQQVENHAVLRGIAGSGIRHSPRLLERDALVDEESGVTAVVEDEVRTVESLRRPVEDAIGAVPVLGEGLALPGEHRNTLGPVDGAGRADHDGSRSFVQWQDAGFGERQHDRQCGGRSLQQHGEQHAGEDEGDQ